jgi:demethylmenaquinone methyltransferase/2-methoxy-6-polyprenyl-1,4-benzoquinol methylase
LYTALAPFYEYLVPLVSSRARALGLSWLNLRSGERALDVGCGTGRALVRMIGATAEEGGVEGIDATPAMIARARARLAPLPHSHYRLTQGPAQDLPYPRNTFDAVFSSYLLDVLPRPAVRPVLREIRRVLRPDGRFVLVVLAPPVCGAERLWAALARAIPVLLGGGRPIRSVPSLIRSGFSVERRASRTQLGLRSGIVRAVPRD